MSRAVAELRHRYDQYAPGAFPDSHNIGAAGDRQNQTVRLTFLPASGAR